MSKSIEEKQPVARDSHPNYSKTADQVSITAVGGGGERLPTQVIIRTGSVFGGWHRKWEGKRRRV